MGADGVEVAQKHDIPLVVPRVQVGQDLLEHGLGPAVGIGGIVLRAALGDGDELRLAIHRGARREHDVLAAVFAGHIGQHQSARDVVPVVLQRLGHTLAHGFEAGEMDDDVYGMGREDGLQSRTVENARLVERERGSSGVGDGALIGEYGGNAGDLPHAPHGLAAGIAQVVYDDNLVALL